MTVPRTGNDGAQRSNQEDDATSHGNAGFSCLVISSTGGALHSHAGDTQTCHGHNDADDHEGTGRLERSVELQDGVVDFALDLSGALEGAGHPQPLVHRHRGDDVVPDIRRHLPLGQNGANDQSN